MINSHSPGGAERFLHIVEKIVGEFPSAGHDPKTPGVRTGALMDFERGEASLNPLAIILMTNQKFQSYSLKKSSPSIELLPLAFAVPRKIEWLEEAANGAKIRVFTPSPLTDINTLTINNVHLQHNPHSTPFNPHRTISITVA